ncbi:hypothetical protein HK103_003449 [Boothiomyces macroporosus]|uniref:Amino acid permease n=1 Tax=Boothiomyces macroporosus TaxID=261099 RepID=A0AAD5UIJ7_9FUNG|nr:hypothetical protein HK103_003449 [Boothiomyces macroporosus]
MFNKISQFIQKLQLDLFQFTLIKVDDDYLKQRLLHPSWISKSYLLFFSIATVISGEYSAWNMGLVNGWGSLFSAAIIANLYYWCLLLCLAELSTAMPFSGGQLTFVAATMGNVFAYIVGFTVFMQFLLLYSQTALVVGDFYMTLAGLTNQQMEYYQYFVNLIVILFCSAIATDLKLFCRVVWGLTAISIIMIVVVLILMIPKFHLGAFQMNLGFDNGPFLNNGITGIFQSIPYAIWLFIGIECTPNLAEEVDDVETTIPASMLGGFGVLTLLASISMVLVGCNPGIQDLEGAIYPLNDLLFANYNVDPNSATGVFFKWIMSFGITVSTLGCMMGCIRLVYALSRGGYFPHYLSLTCQSRAKGSFANGTPLFAIAGSAVAAYGMMIVTFLLDSTPVGSFLVYGSAFYGLIAGMFTFASYLILKVRSPSLKRPFSLKYSVISYTVPIIGLVLSIISIGGCFSADANNTILLYIMVIQVILSLIYYIFVVRKRLVLSADQKFIRAQIAKIKMNSIQKEREMHTNSRKEGVTSITSKTQRLFTLDKPAATKKINEHELPR